MKRVVCFAVFLFFLITIPSVLWAGDDGFAEKIINSFESPYEAVAGLVTLRIMEALSADISVYQNQTIQDVAWYVQQQFYQDNVIPDPYGRYMSVRSSLDMEEMIASQYVK